MTSTRSPNELIEAIRLARLYEPERYIAATLAPEPERTALIALAAFAAGLQRIAADATEPLLGEIRLQWWRDSLDQLADGGRTGAPLADAIGAAMITYALPPALPAAMTEARAFDLYDDPMPDAAALDGYLAKTEAIPFELALRVLGVASSEAAELAAPAGRVFGFTRLLARLPVHLAAGRLPLPREVLDRHGVTSATMLAGTTTPAVRAMVATLARDISATGAVLRPRIMALSRRQRASLLPLALVLPYVHAIGAHRRDPLRDIADLAPMTRVWRIAVAHWSGRF